MTKLFDTHAHYFADRFNELDGGADAILSSEEFRETVGKVICVGSDPINVHISTNLARKYDFMYAAVGIHPEDAQSMCKKTPDEEIYDCVESLVFDERERKENKIVAIGEIGFDYFCKPTDKPLQYEYFYKKILPSRHRSQPQRARGYSQYAPPFSRRHRCTSQLFYERGNGKGNSQAWLVRLVFGFGDL